MIDLKLEDIYTDENIKNSLNLLLVRRNTCGNDGIMLHSLPQYLEDHKNFIDNIINNIAEPTLASMYEIQSKSGKQRTIYKINSIDKFILKTLSDAISLHVDKLLSINCIAYRKNMGTKTAAEILKSAVDAGDTFVVKVDLEDFFENINFDILYNILCETFSDNRITQTIMKFINIKYEKEYTIYTKTKGLIQGSPLSPILSNLYLNQFDKWLESKNFISYRYSDDIAVFCSNYETSVKLYEDMVSCLQIKFGLKINKKKSGIFDLFSQKYLGYILIKNLDDNSYEVVKDFKKSDIYNYWQKSGLNLNDDTIEIIENGILTVKDTTILFDGEKTKKFIPVKTTSNINIYSDVIINGTLISFLNQNKIPLTIFDKHGIKIGRFVPDRCVSVANTFIEQVKCYVDEEKRLNWAKEFAVAEVFNMKSNLQYYSKHFNSVVIEKSLEILSQIIINIKNEKSMKKLLMEEARAKESYFSCFNDILPHDDFEFMSRTRRPPKDAINALISFGNTVMYNYIANEIFKTSLDIKVGFLHSTNKRAESLNLDIAEIFKPVIVDRCIFKIINRHMINEKNHFEYGEDKVWLTQEGKRIYLSAFYKKLSSTLSVKGKKLTYRKLIWEEIIKIQRSICYGEKYKAYHYNV